jgi:ectoine hydroxylase-related dioxygenase (phytanoyl-CoA dioxygenase family)
MDFKYEYDKYYCNDYSDITKYLEKYGVCIVDLLNEKEIQIMRDGMWNNLEFLSKFLDIPIDRNNKDTYKSIYKLHRLHTMLIQQYGIGHSDISWFLRIKAMEVYKVIYNTDELLSSFDGCSYNIQCTLKKPNKNQINFDLHCDQSFMRNELETIQSWITAYDVEEGYGSLIFLENSNKYHRDVNIQNKTNWHILRDEEINFFKNKGCELKVIKCPKGSMVLWDSRTIHAPLPPQILQLYPRCVHYVCLYPKKYCRKAILRKRIKAFEENRTTGHNPINPKLFPDYPRKFNKVLPNIKKFENLVINDQIKKLVGYV